MRISLLTLLFLCTYNISTQISGSNNGLFREDTKRWFIYIQENAYDVLKLPCPGLAEYLHLLLENSFLMLKQCGMNVANKLPSVQVVDESDSIHNDFCGIIVINKYRFNSTRFYITVQRQFYIKFDFLMFNLTDYATDCKIAALLLFQIQDRTFVRYPQWIYCGQREPWTIIITVNIALIEFERNYPITPAIVVQYYACEPATYERHAYIYLLSNYLKHLNNGDGICPVKFYVKYLEQKWTIFVGYGHAVRFLTMRHFNITGHLDIYDGQQTMNRIFNDTIDVQSRAKSRKQMNSSSTYMKSVVAFIVMTKQPGRKSYFAVLFRRIPSPDVRFVPLNSDTSVRHTKGLLHTVYYFKSSNGDYPKLTLTFRKFDGFNEGGCSHGGFLLRQPPLIGNNTERNHGPYCKDSSLRYISHHYSSL